MAHCPVCKVEIAVGADSCPVCGHEFDGEEHPEWAVLGSIGDKLSADFAAETLKSMNIPVVVVSRSGFFGDVGLPLNPFYKSSEPMYEILVPPGFEEQAADALDGTMSGKWQRKEK